MSLQLIQQYHPKVDKIIQYGGSCNESALRFTFQTLLEQYCTGKNLELIAEMGDFGISQKLWVFEGGGVNSLIEHCSIQH
ncbi:MAG: hypothetical protein GY845_07790 [Planctomycetes bacterium]|nr:hypothetical protein [Planctomycetota bacterium]